MTVEWTFVTDDGVAGVDAHRAGSTVLVAPDALAPAIGWELKPEGLCRGDTCVPVRDRTAMAVDGLVDLAAVAAVLRAPFVVDDEVDVAVLGASAADRAHERAGLRVAGDMLLRDIDGGDHRWSTFGRKKKLLFAWASW